MRNIKPAVLAVLGCIWPFGGIFLASTLSKSFPVMAEGWVMCVLLFLVVVPSVALPVFALALSRAKRDGFAKGRVYKYLTFSQICLLCDAFLLVVILSLAEYGHTKIADMVYLPFMMLSGLAILLAIIGLFSRDLAEPPPEESVTPAPTHAGRTSVCVRCGIALSLLKEEQIRLIDGKLYCDACMDVMRTQKEEAHKRLHTVCCVCGIDHPRSEMIMVDDSYFCQDCFSKKYAEEFFEAFPEEFPPEE